MNIFLWPLAIAIVFISNSCGDAKFGGTSTKKGSSDANANRNAAGSIVAPNVAYNSISWLWTCDSASSTPPLASDRDLVFVDGGDHPIDGTRVDGVPLNFSGKLCTPKQLPMDIVFVVDVSTSMRDNDPASRLSGITTCGRRRAVEQVISGISVNSDVQYSIVTFSSVAARAGRTSAAFFRDQALLFSDLAGGAEVGTVLCANDGNTEYTDGLLRAKGLLEKGRVSATKEIYFVSDGNPNTGFEGLAIAEQLKKPGIVVGAFSKPVVIATVMIGTESGTVLRDSISSKALDGSPLFARSTADQLAQVLAGLAQNEITGGEIRYRSIGNASWTSIPLLSFTQGYEFSLPSINIERSKASRGIEVQYEYWDKRDNRFLSGGNLTWTAGQGQNLWD